MLTGQSPTIVLRVVALILALVLPGLPLAQAAGVEKKPCGMHQAVKRLPCHESPSAAREKHDCCKNELRFTRDACACGHGDEASGVSREPSLAPKRARFALVLPEARVVERATAAFASLADPPDPRPPSARS